jgi:hypothetical protein
MITKRKFGLYGIIAAVHGIMILFYQIPFPNPENIHQPLPTSPVVMAAGTKWDAALQKHPLTPDPLLLARAHEKGFTGGLWSKSFESPNPYNDWNETPRYLDHPELAWGHAFGEFVSLESQSLRKPLTKPISKLEPIETQTQHLPRVSTFQFSQNLKDRIPTQQPDLPLWQGPKPLESTRMQIGIHSMGMVQSIRLLNQGETDSIQSEFLKQAIRTAKQLKFRPIKDSPSSVRDKLQWGEIEIQWEQALPATNQQTKHNQEVDVR